MQNLAKLHPQHVVAYSMGGRLALESLLYYKARFLSLTLLSTSISFENMTERLKKEGVWIEVLNRLSIEDFIKYWYNQTLFEGFTPPPSRLKQNKDDLIKVLEEYSITKMPCLKKHTDTLVHYIYRKGDEKGESLKNAHFIEAKSHAIHLEKAALIKAFLQATI